MRRLKKSIGSQIRARRIERGFPNQLDLAVAVGVDQSRVSRWENGHELPEGENRRALVDVLKIDAESFFDIDDRRPARPPQRDLKLLIEGDAEDLPIRLLEPLLAAFLGSDREGRATALAALLNDKSISDPYLKKPASPAKPSRVR